jgi:CheY-like chemotaxis protein
MDNHNLDNLNPSFKQRETILVVEDEVQMQEVMGELLQSNGYSVLLANDGLEAIEMYKQRGSRLRWSYWMSCCRSSMDGIRTTN